MAIRRNDNPRENPRGKAHTSTQRDQRLPVRRILPSCTVLLACLVSTRAVAQSATSLFPDASVLRRNGAAIEMRFSPMRWDAVFGTGLPGSSTRNLAWGFNAESLGVAALPQLTPAQTAIRTLANLPNFQLTTGKLVAVADSRVLTLPVILQYGLTSRLTLGVVVPIVETRTVSYVQLNPKPGFANVGPNPALLDAQQRAAAATLVSSLRLAATTLQQKLSQCQATPGTTDCATLLTRQAEVQSLVQSGGTFASAIEQLYGSDTDHPGQPFVPLAGGLIQRGIDFQIKRLSEGFKSFLGDNVVAGSVTGSAGPAAQAELQSLLTGVGRDTLRLVDRSSIGDVSVGATLQVVNTLADSASRRGYRLAVNGTYRIGTGQPANRNRLFEIGTGYGQNGVEAGAAADVQFGRRLAASAVGSYTVQLGTIDVPRVANTVNSYLPLIPPNPGTYSAGNVAMVSVKPRVRISGFLAAFGQYTFTHAAADKYTLGPAVTDSAGTVLSVPPAPPFGLSASTAHQIGFGFLYSSLVAGDARPGRLPFELSFSHLETITASGGPTPKAFRDQVVLRVYVGR